MTIFEQAVDQIAPHLRDGALVVLRSTVYPGTTAYVAQHLAERGCARRRRVLPGAHRRGPRARGAARRCRRSSAPTTTRAADRADGAVRHLGAEDHPHDDQGGRAGEALHQHLALHEVRRREPVLHDRRPGRASITRTSCARSARTTRARRTCRARASPPARACSRTRCSSPRSRPTTSRWARPPCRSTRACRPTSWRRSSDATAACTGKTVGILGHGLQGRVRRPARVALATSCASSCRGPAPGCSCTDPYVDDDRARAARRRARRRATSSSSARRTARTAASSVGGRDVVDVWGVLGEGIRL